MIRAVGLGHPSAYFTCNIFCFHGLILLYTPPPCYRGGRFFTSRPSLTAHGLPRRLFWNARCLNCLPFIGLSTVLHSAGHSNKLKNCLRLDSDLNGIQGFYIDAWSASSTHIPLRVAVLAGYWTAFSVAIITQEHVYCVPIMIS